MFVSIAKKWGVMFFGLGLVMLVTGDFLPFINIWFDLILVLLGLVIATLGVAKNITIPDRISKLCHNLAVGTRITLRRWVFKIEESNHRWAKQQEEINNG
ncbi:hypothetical protein GW933_00745 [Candidatus Falkowbacteria bacterium]|uniref:Uncharacterized protein n=1 Tax=Candidatus Buchananbacteria bacterium CG10_big_fil_rev_8_21_14_0_10_33_19 TaxID=1974525 RepID=A0A2H0W346_9BACT|nr:hypothetical protein [Candidatus Falkowbacteria bacterium]PIS05782.1 MAG: hypothetical protein COT80_03370 [Candidatus Buchananbacteria bacterium CG10_big_fil_rev_8_21_14_0_10_33_19]